jgi:hypothetical protein
VTKVESDIRMALAERGIEMKPVMVQEILQAAADIAILVGGTCVIDTTKNWGLWVEQMDAEGEKFSADVIWFDEEDEGEVMN